MDQETVCGIDGDVMESVKGEEEENVVFKLES